jgi:hypothetical protein
VKLSGAPSVAASTSSQVRGVETVGVVAWRATSRPTRSCGRAGSG